MPLPKHPLPDPVFASSLRELKWILAIWSVNFIWVVGYCVLYGYYEEEAPLATVIGMPSWVFWGVFLPWILSIVVSAWFAFAFMEDHPLDPVPKDPIPKKTPQPASDKNTDPPIGNASKHGGVR